MSTIFEKMDINYSEYSYFKALKDKEKLQYLFELFDVRDHKQINLSGFFETIHDALFDSPDTGADPVRDTNDHVDVTIDIDNIMIESNSLRALKFVTYKFIESGYMLRRDTEVEKMFKKDKLTRYLRVFKIISNCPGICFN